MGVGHGISVRGEGELGVSFLKMLCCRGGHVFKVRRVLPWVGAQIRTVIRGTSQFVLFLLLAPTNLQPSL
jgi:hypothetical protein